MWPVVQTAAASGLAWWLCQEFLDHPRPVFAAVTTIVAMGASTGGRGRQVVSIIAATTMGIVLGELLLTGLGTGPVGVAVVVLIAMSAALLIDTDPLFVTNVAISGMLFVAAEQTQGFTPDRLLDGLVGGAVAIVISTVLFPIAPVRHILETAQPVLTSLQTSLADAAVALETGDVARAERARARTFDHIAVTAAVALGRDVIRVAPLRRRRDHARVLWLRDRLDQLPAIARSTRIAVAVSHRLVRESHEPLPYLAAPMKELATAMEAFARWIEEDDAEAVARIREHAAAAGRAAALRAPIGSLGEATVQHLTQVLARRLLLTTGMSEDEADALGLYATGG
jgi:uncharacterized membrane protein YgaE (UPF0421/DUF939 family)